MARLGSTGRAAATYITLAGLQRGVSLLVLPFVTHVMSVSDYGAASTLSAATLLVIAVTAAPLTQLTVRAAARSDHNGPSHLRVVGFYCYVVLPIGIAVVAAAVAVLMPEALGVRGTLWAIELLAIGLQPAAMNFAMWVARAREDLRLFVRLSLTSVFATMILKLILVVVLRLGVLGWVVSDLLSAILSALVAIALVRLPRAPMNASHVRYVIKFTLPLIPHTASLWALTALSRPAMAAVSTLQQVGLLSFGLNLATLAGLVLAETNAATLPRYAREVFPAPTQESFAPVKLQLIAALIVPAIVGCGVAVAGRLVFASDYWPSFRLTGVLLIGQAAYGMYLIPMNYLTQTAGLTKFSSIASGAGAAVILVSILIVARSFGAAGVAYATVAGYATMAATAMALMRTHKLDIAWHSWLVAWPEALLAVAALGCAVMALMCPVGSIVTTAFTLASSAFAIIAIAFTLNRRTLT